MVVLGGQLTLCQPLQCAQGRLDPGLGADDVADDLFALLLAEVERREHFEVGAHRGQRGAQLVGRDRREVARRGERRLGAALFLPHAADQTLDGVGDLDGFGGAADVDVGCFVTRLDLAGLLRQPLEGSHRERRQQPSAEGRRTHRQGADD